MPPLVRDVLAVTWPTLVVVAAMVWAFRKRE
jgi:hypothetical protein